MSGKFKTGKTKMNISCYILKPDETQIFMNLIK